MRVAVLWFRRDLRLQDNALWVEAVAGYDAAHAVLVLPPAGPHSLTGLPRFTPAKARFVGQCAAELGVALGSVGVALTVVPGGRPADVLPDVVAAVARAPLPGPADKAVDADDGSSRCVPACTFAGPYTPAAPPVQFIQVLASTNCVQYGAPPGPLHGCDSPHPIRSPRKFQSL